MTLPIQELGRLISLKRGSRGIRSAALEAGVSAATLSRVENGNIPDLETFAKICQWLEVEPSQFLGFPKKNVEEVDLEGPVVVHFRKKRTFSPDTASALGELILAAQRAMDARDGLRRT